MHNKVFFNDNKIILPMIRDCSIDLIITDPPYEISKESNFYKGDNTKFCNISHDFGEWDRDVIDWELYMKEFYRVLRKGGRLIMFYDIWKMGIIKRLGIEMSFSQPRMCTWEKTNPIPINSKHNYLSNSKEYFISLTKQGWIGKDRAKSTFNSEYNSGTYNYPTISGKECIGHPTQKPIKLFEEIIKTNSNVGNIILDPFIGSGTTGVACGNIDRNYIGIENNSEYIKMCEKRNLFISK